MRPGHIGAALIAVLVAVAVVAAAARSDRESTPPGASTADQGPGGLSLWYALLGVLDRDLERAVDPPSDGGLDPADTAVLLDPGRVAERERDALATFVERGGRLVIGGRVDSGTLGALADPGLGGSADPTGPALTLLPLPVTGGIVGVESTESRFASAGAALPVIGDERAWMVLATRGEGEVVALADSAPLTNSGLPLGDNALLAVALTGDQTRRVVFIEDVGAATADEGLAVLPSRWAWSFALLLGAALLLIWARGRRFGPPDIEGRELAPPRRDYVDALAGTLVRTGRAAESAEPLRLAARRRLAAAHGMGDRERELDADTLARMGEASELTPREAGVLTEPVATDQDAIAAARALARLWS